MSNSNILNEELLAEFISHAASAGTAAANEALVARLSADEANPDVWRQLAEGMVKSGFAPAAVDFLDIAVSRFPHVPCLRYWRGNALRLSARYTEGESDFRRVLDNVPCHRDAALSLAFMLREYGRLSAAADVIAAAWLARTSSLEESIEDLIFLRECGAHLRAHELAQAAHRRWPKNSDIAALAAEFALAVGEFAIARKCLHATLDRNPGESASWLRLAYCQRYRSRDDPDLRLIADAWQNEALDAQAHMCTGFALGKALDDLGDNAGAVRVLRDVNAMAAARTSWRLQHWQQLVERQLIERELPRVETDDAFAPVFVIGLPRTGTTLIASLLARDPRLRDRGELNWIDGMYTSLVEQRKLHDLRALSKVARLVSAQMRRDDAPASWYLDKNPLNFRYLNLIAALCPQAKIIRCRRRLPDTTLSLWMQHFTHEDLGFSYDFSSIAAFAQGYERLMMHWRETLRLPVFNLDYEALATDTETTLERIGEFIGMAPPEESTLSTSASVITTASVWQARQPVYTSSIDRWTKYAKYLPELQQFL